MKRFGLPLVFLALFALLILWQPLVKQAALDGLLLCAQTLLPSLLPFSVTANLFLLLQLHTQLSPLLAVPLRLLRQPKQAAAPLLLGLLGGYPIGIFVLCAVYQDGTLRQDEAVSLSRICNQAGPAFLVGAAGLSLFGSVRVGLLLWLVQLLSMICTARLLCPGTPPLLRVRKCAVQAPPLPLREALPAAISQSSRGLLSVCCLVVYFSTVLALIRALPGVGLLPSAAAGLLFGSLELTNGLFALAPLSPFPRFVLASVLLGWGGLCVQFQGASALAKAELPQKSAMLGKLVQAFAALPIACSVAALAGLDGFPLSPSLRPLALAAAPLLLIFVFFCQNSRNQRKDLL